MKEERSISINVASSITTRVKDSIRSKVVRLEYSQCKRDKTAVRVLFQFCTFLESRSISPVEENQILNIIHVPEIMELKVRKGTKGHKKLFCLFYSLSDLRGTTLR